jgi:hypothetical protein
MEDVSLLICSSMHDTTSVLHPSRLYVVDLAVHYGSLLESCPREGGCHEPHLHVPPRVQSIIYSPIPLHSTPLNPNTPSNSAFVRNCHSSYGIPTLSSMYANFSSMPYQASRPERRRKIDILSKRQDIFNLTKQV